MNIAEELRKLEELHRSGAISDEEYAKAKQLALAGVPPGDRPTELLPLAGEDKEQQTRQWAMFLHLSQFAGYLVPLAGLIVPIVLWQIKKAELPRIDDHGKVVANWIISEIIYAAIGVILLFVLIGIPLLIVLGILGIIFPIVGAIKASNGELWKYPLSIPFFKVGAGSEDLRDYR
jgi:uncharacterized Tic20 family protein